MQVIATFYVLSSLRGTFYRVGSQWGWEPDLENATLFVSEEELRNRVVADLKTDNLSHFRIDKYNLVKWDSGTFRLTKDLGATSVKSTTK
jgi:hypothetical protein